MDEVHTWRAYQYISLNPVRAKMVALPEDYPWSSAAAHRGLRADSVLSASINDLQTAALANMELANWQNNAEILQAQEFFQENETKNKPFGSDEFIQRLELLTGRNLRTKSLGRPFARKILTGSNSILTAKKEAPIQGYSLCPKTKLK